MIKIFDWYLKAPLLLDIFIGIIIIITLKFTVGNDFSKETLDNLQSLQTNLIDTSVSLAGFILAALTIIVTFKANYDSKKRPEDATSGMELFFSSKIYYDVVGVYKWAIAELIFNFIMLYAFNIWFDYFINLAHFSVVLIGLLIIVVALIRCMYIMFLVIDIEANKKKDEEKQKSQPY